MLEALLGVFTLMIGYWMLAIIVGLIVGFAIIVFEWVVQNWLVILSVVLLLFLVFRYSKSVLRHLKNLLNNAFCYLKSLNTKLQPKTTLGVRLMLVLNMLTYNIFSFFILDFLIFQIITITLSFYAVYFLIKPNEYFKIISQKN